MGETKKNSVLVLLFLVSFVTVLTQELSESVTSSYEELGEGQKIISLEGDTKVNDFAALKRQQQQLRKAGNNSEGIKSAHQDSEEDHEPFYESDETIDYQSDEYEWDSDEATAESEDASGESGGASSLEESRETPGEGKDKEGSEKSPGKIMDASVETLGPKETKPSEKDELIYSDEEIDEEVQVQTTHAPITLAREKGTEMPPVEVVDIAEMVELQPAFELQPSDSIAKELEKELIENQDKKKEPEIIVFPDNLPAPADFEVVQDDEDEDDSDSEEDNKVLTGNLSPWNNPKYVAIAKEHKALFTGIIIGFFALAIATVLFTFYRGFVVFSQIIRRRTGSGVNYQRMEEEQEIISPVFQQKV